MMTKKDFVGIADVLNNCWMHRDFNDRRSYVNAVDKFMAFLKKSNKNFDVDKFLEYLGDDEQSLHEMLNLCPNCNNYLSDDFVCVECGKDWSKGD